MSEIFTSDIRIRAAREGDICDILNMVRELAEFERLLDQVVATEEDYRKSLFGENSAAEALVAESEDGLIGYAIFFSTFSTFVGRAGIWLEDLYVRPAFRKKGIGKQLLKAVGRIAEERNAGRYEWSVLDWNEPALKVYRLLGAKPMKDWTVQRLAGDHLQKLARSFKSN